MSTSSSSEPVSDSSSSTPQQPQPQQSQSQEPTRRPTAAESAVVEKRAARTMTLGKAAYVLIAAIAGYVGFLLLPYAGSARGYEALLGTSEVTTTIEQVHAVLLTVGIGIASTLVVITRFAPAGLIGWMCVTVALPYSLFSLWVRHTGPHDGENTPHSIGMYVGIVAAIFAFGAYCSVALKRNPQQQAAARMRADSTTIDDIARLQRASGMEVQNTDYDSNPLLVDDRRRHAASRTQRDN